MALAQLLGGTRQVERRTMRRAGRNAQHGLRCGNDPHHRRAVFDQQLVGAAHQRALRQEHAERATQRIQLFIFASQCCLFFRSTPVADLLSGACAG